MEDQYVRGEIRFLAVTLVGPAKAGKTALVNAFVNNTFESQYQPTGERMFYYTYFKPAAADSEEFDTTSWCIEIEDTPAFDCNDEESQDIFMMLPNGAKATNRVHQQQKLDEEQRKGKKGDDDKDRYPCLTSLVEAPVEHIKAITCNRMVYLFVFDCNDEKSYKEALGSYELMNQYREKKGSTKAGLNPITIFVAAQTDKNPWDRTYKQVKQSAKAWSKTNQISLSFVSAKQFKSIKMLFRKAVEKAKEQETLWNIRKPDMDAKNDITQHEKCSLQ